MMSSDNKSFIARLTHGAFSLGMVWVPVMMVLTSVDVGCRYLFSAPVPGTLELSEIMLALFGMLGMAYVERNNANVRVEIIEKVMPRKVMLSFDVLTSFLSLSIMILLVWQSWFMGIEEYHYKTATDTLGIPLYPLFFLLSVSTFILVLELFSKMIKLVQRLIKD